MADLPDDIAKEVGKARVSGGGNYILHGNYPALMVKDWIYEKKYSGRCIVLEMIVVESHKNVVYEGATKVDDEPNAIGSECSTVANFDGGSKESASGNSRAPVLGLFGLEDSKIDDAAIELALKRVCNEKIANGMILACTTFPKEKRSKRGEYITGLKFECVSKPGEGINTPELVRARLDAMKAGNEAAVKVAAEHLAKFRASVGTVAPKVAAPSSALPPPPAAAVPPPLAADPLAVALAAGWLDYPGRPDLLYRGEIVKPKSEVLAGIQ